MLLNFKQGIVQKQSSPDVLTSSGGDINIEISDVPLILNFSHGKSDYLYEIKENISNAWVGVGVNDFLYVDIDFNSGNVSFGSTPIEPDSGSLLPSSPQTGQHFFDFKDNYMKVWTGGRWETKIRLFIGEINSGVPESYNVGSTVNLLKQVDSGYIIFYQNNTPVKKLNNSAFLTTSDAIYSQKSVIDGIKLSFMSIYKRASQPISKSSCVTLDSDGKVKTATNVEFENPVRGVSTQSSPRGEITNFKVHGYYEDNNFNWSQADFNKPLYVDSNGNLTPVMPVRYSFQKVGYIVNQTTIFIAIGDVFVLNVSEEVTPTPTPSSTISPTPTITPTPSISESATPTPTITPSNSGSGSLPSLNSEFTSTSGFNFNTASSLDNYECIFRFSSNYDVEGYDDNNTYSVPETATPVKLGEWVDTGLGPSPSLSGNFEIRITIDTEFVDGSPVSSGTIAINNEMSSFVSLDQDRTLAIYANNPSTGSNPNNATDITQNSGITGAAITIEIREIGNISNNISVSGNIEIEFVSP